MTLRDLWWYFLRLGAFGFGGPIALVGYMQRDLVERLGWIEEAEYREGLALAQLAPGPLAAQLAMYIGWLRAGAWGATVVGVAFVAPSFLMVFALSALYLRFGGMPWMQGAFYGIAAAVIGIIARSSYKLVVITVGRDGLLWLLFLINAAVVVWTETEVAWLILATGLVVLFVRVRPWRLWLRAQSAALIAIPTWFVSQPSGLADSNTLAQLLWFFARAGALVFGSGLAIVPFLYGGAVEHYHWLTDRQFLDAVAVSMITPGPVVITVAFIGYLAAGPLGAVAASIGVFLPVYLAVVLLAPYFRRFSKNTSVHAFVVGVTVAATGAIAGAAIVLGRRALIDGPAILIAVTCFLLLLWLKKTPEPAVILAAGALGFVLRS
jgi:chromate transporter